MHLTTSPPSEPHAGTSTAPAPCLSLLSPAQLFACLAVPLHSLPSLSSSVLPSLCLSISSFGTGADSGCSRCTPLWGDKM